MNVNNIFQETKIAADRLFEIFEYEEEDDDKQKNSFSRADCGDIKIEDIKFRYGSREIIFENFNASIRPRKNYRPWSGKAEAEKPRLLP